MIEAKLLKANENVLAENSCGKTNHSKGQDKNGSRDDIECWNCRKLGHTKAKFRDKTMSKSKKGKSSKEGNNSTNVATKDDDAKAFAFTSTFTGPTHATTVHSQTWK